MEHDSHNHKPLRAIMGAISFSRKWQSKSKIN